MDIYNEKSKRIYCTIYCYQNSKYPSFFYSKCFGSTIHLGECQHNQESWYRLKRWNTLMVEIWKSNILFTQPSPSGKAAKMEQSMSYEDFGKHITTYWCKPVSWRWNPFLLQIFCRHLSKFPKSSMQMHWSWQSQNFSIKNQMNVR